MKCSLVRHGALLLLISLSSAPLFACPDMQGEYQPEKSQTHLYLKKQDANHYQVVIDIPGYPLMIQAAQFISAQEQNDGADQMRLPECTLDIERFGYLMPYKKGSVYHLHFDSQDYEKVINADFVLKLNNKPTGIMGVSKLGIALPEKAIAALNNQ